MSCLVLSLVLQKVITMHAGKVLCSSCAGKHGAWYKTNSKSSSHFPNFDASNAWHMGHNSRQGFYLGQELLLDFAAWIDLTLNADNSRISKQRSKLQNTFCFFKTCWRSTGLSRLDDASQPPGRLQGTLKQCLNTERSYKRQGHATLKHFVGFFVQWCKAEITVAQHRSRGEIAFFRQNNGVISVE